MNILQLMLLCKSKEWVWTAPECLRHFAQPHAARHLKSHRRGRIGDQIGSKVIIESNQEELACAGTPVQNSREPGCHRLA